MKIKYTEDEISSARQGDKLKLECEYCGKDFLKSKKKILLVVRGNAKSTIDACRFCSRECSNSGNKTGAIIPCVTCGKEVYRQISQVSNNTFCSKSCSATARNTGRKRTEEEKLKVSIKLFRGKISEKKQPIFRPFHPCAVCGAKREKKRKTCSISCASTQKTGEQPLLLIKSAKEVFDKFVLDNNRMPSKREHPLLLNFARRHFKTWNKMVIAFGYTPMTKNLTKKRIRCNDGHIVDSCSERIIDEFLTSNNIKHDVHKKYSDSNYISDFYLTEYDTYVEYFGLSGEFDSYDETIKSKLAMFESAGTKVVSIFPKDLFPSSKLPEKLGKFIKFQRLANAATS